MTNLAPHPIELEQVIFTRVSVIAIAGHIYKENAECAAPENDIQVSKMEDADGRYQVVMTTTVNKEGNKESPYSIDIECLAILHADATLSEADAHRGITITGHSVLFGAIRETIAWLTSRQPYGPLMLGLSVLRPKQKPPEP